MQLPNACRNTLWLTNWEDILVLNEIFHHLLCLFIVEVLLAKIKVDLHYRNTTKTKFTNTCKVLVF